MTTDYLSKSSFPKNRANGPANVQKPTPKIRYTAKRTHMDNSPEKAAVDKDD
jgi:hypothetical protein